jgi:hemolysin activation/secretion protein
MQEHLRRIETARPPAIPGPAVPPPPPRSRAPDTAVNIAVSEIQFTQSALLSQAELAAIGQRYVGRSLTAADIQQLLDDISALYRVKGVLTAVPVLPQQNLYSGLLKVLLVEGKLGEVQVKNAGSINSEWVKQWFDLQQGSVVTQDQIREKLARFNAASDLTATADFVPGRRFGLSDLQVTVQHAPRLQTWAMLDASRTGNSAPAQLSVGLRLAPFSPVGGRADLAFLTDAQSRTAMASASVPDGYRGWRVGLTGSVSETRSRIAPDDAGGPALRVLGRSSAAALDISKRWVLGAPWSINTSLSIGTIRSSTFIDDSELFARQTDRYTLSSILSYDGERSQGALRTSAVSAQSEGQRLNYLEAGTPLLTALDAGSHWRLRLNGLVRWSASNSTAIAGEGLQLGGTDTVRGYDPATISTPSGHALQIELRYRGAPSEPYAPEAYVFMDAGRSTANGASQPLRSAGVGLQARVNPHLGLEVLGSRQLKSPAGPRARLSLRAIMGW